MHNLTEIFAVFDTDNSGSLTHDEFAAMMQALLRNKINALRLLMLTHGGRHALLMQAKQE